MLSTAVRFTKWDLPDRIETAAMVALVGLGALIGYLGMDQEWDSGHQSFAALFIACLLGGLLVLLPSIGLCIALSVMLLFHFGGMLTVATMVDPPNASGPWVSKQLWAYVDRPYLQFMYLANAYHFYSPDPGPPVLYVVRHPLQRWLVHLGQTARAEQQPGQHALPATSAPCRSKPSVRPGTRTATCGGSLPAPAGWLKIPFRPTVCRSPWSRTWRS